MDKILGLNIEKLSKEIESNIPEEITDLKKERDEARNKKEWERGDELRDEIEKAGYILEDRAGKTTLKKTLPLLV
jgi:cysteinyl-tRNA synthetase